MPLALLAETTLKAAQTTKSGTNNKNTTLNGLLKSVKIDLDTIHFKVVFLWKNCDWEFVMMKHKIWRKS